METGNQQYNPPAQPPVQPTPGPRPYPAEDGWPHMTVGNWIVTFLLMCIPIANIVLMFVWAFGSNVNPSKRNYFRASLLMALAGIVLSIVFWAGIASFLMNFMYMF